MNYYGGFSPQYGGSYQPNQGMYGNPRMDFLQQTQQNMQAAPQGMQIGELQARSVMCKEEAVAAQVLPNGLPYLFDDPANEKIYRKRFDPQTGMSEMLTYVLEKSAQQPQYATIDMVNELRAQLEQLRGERTAKGGDVEI